MTEKQPKLRRNVGIMSSKERRLDADFSKPGDSVALAVERARVMSARHGRPLPEPEMEFETYRHRQLTRGIYVEPGRIKPNARSPR